MTAEMSRPNVATAERDRLTADLRAMTLRAEAAERCVTPIVEAAERLERDRLVIELREARRLLVRIDDGLNREGWEEGENDNEWGQRLDDYLFNVGLCPATPEHAAARKALMRGTTAAPGGKGAPT